MQRFEACQGRLSRQVQASLSQDPPLQVPGSQVDLSLEHLRRGQRPHLLPLNAADERTRLKSDGGGLPRDIARLPRADRPGAISDEGVRLAGRSFLRACSLWSPSAAIRPATNSCAAHAETRVATAMSQPLRHREESADGAGLSTTRACCAGLRVGSTHAGRRGARPSGTDRRRQGHGREIYAPYTATGRHRHRQRTELSRARNSRGMIDRC